MLTPFPVEVDLLIAKNPKPMAVRLSESCSSRNNSWRHKFPHLFDLSKPVPPIVIDRDYIIHKGHSRTACAKRQGKATVMAVWHDEWVQEDLKRKKAGTWHPRWFEKESSPGPITEGKALTDVQRQANQLEG
jgi:hypothetical protein